MRGQPLGAAVWVCLALVLTTWRLGAQSDPARDQARLAELMVAARAELATGGGRTQRVPLTEAVTLAERLGDKPNQALALRLLASLENNAGALADAVAHAQAAATLFREVGDGAGEALSLRAVAVATNGRGRPEEALQVLNQALVAARRAQAADAEADVQTSLASVLGPLGRLIDAKHALEAAVRVRGDRPEPMTLNLLGVVSRNLGDYDAAVRYYQQAIETATRSNTQVVVAQTLGNLGNVYSSLGQYEKAIDVQTEALRIATALDRPSSVANLHGNLGLAFSRLSRLPQAADHLAKAIAIARTIGAPTRLAAALSSLASFRLFRLSDADGAEAAATEALSVAQVAKLPAEESEARAMLGWIGSRQGRRDVALTHFDRAVELAPGRSYKYEALMGRGALLRQMGAFARAESDLRKALGIADEARRFLTSDVEKSDFGESRRDATAYLAAVLADQGRLAESLEVAESNRARGLADLLAQRAIRGKSGTREALTTVRNAADRARATGARGGQTASDESGALSLDLDRFRREGPELASLLTAEAPRFAQISAVATRLHATLVEYLLVDSEAHVWVVSPRAEVHHSRLAVRESDVRSLVETVRARLDRRLARDGALTAALGTLHDRLIDPIASWLPADAGDPVVIVPSPDLQLLPFAALANAQGVPLIARHTLVFAPSLGVFAYTAAKTHPTSAQQTALVVSDPLPPDPDALPRLAGARREGVAVARRLGTTRVTLLEGTRATETAVRAAAPGASTLHFATHGLISTQLPTKSSLVLAKSATDDGYLRVDEVFDLDLEANLVVLSGCSTGFGPVSSEGIAGLVRGFIYAGTPTVVASLWDVGDRSTGVLMDAFYRAMAGGASKAAALRTAQLATRRQFPHPAQWAAFQLTGEPR